MGSGENVGTDECEFRHVAKEMWTNFARTGNPSTDKYQWKKFSGDDRQTMVFDDAIGMQKDLFGRREDLMMSWAERLGNGSSKIVLLLHFVQCMRNERRNNESRQDHQKCENLHIG